MLFRSRRHDHDPPPDYEEAQWVKFDDLDVEERVSPIDDIKQSLKDEMPYLLFYQIVPIVDITASSTDGTEAEPPSYNDTALIVKTTDATPFNGDRPVVSRQASSYFDNLSNLPSATASVRFSSEIDRPRRSLADDDGYLSVSRRGSGVHEAFLSSPALTPIEGPDRKSTRLNSSHSGESRMPSSA